jgi:16S rRNA (cytosine967-C5)-methyltransferase
MVTVNSRQLAFLALRAVQRGAFADIALDQVLHQANLSNLDKRLVTELVYGSLRRQRTLDGLIDQLAQKPSAQQPPDLRLIMQLGLYQLRYLSHIPPSAAVNTTVDLVKQNRLGGLAGFVNGVLRQYLRLSTTGTDPLVLPVSPVQRIGLLHSYPDWIVQVWAEQFGLVEAEQLCQWMNQPPAIDLRINPLRTTLEQVETAMTTAGIAVQRLPYLPQALRLEAPSGLVRSLPGFAEGWWVVQDASAQLVGHLVDPQPGEVVVDACAAPGCKTTHLAELMGDRGTLLAYDKTSSRLKKIQENLDRLQIHCVQLHSGDSRYQPHLAGQADRVLLDAPCSGLGTLNRHVDARWRQTPETVQILTQLQAELLTQAATWVKPTGTLVYATCTLHPAENEQLITQFLSCHPCWTIEPPPSSFPANHLVSGSGWITVKPHQHRMDGFFMVQLKPALP